jgi:hypothetical protein
MPTSVSDVRSNPNDQIYHAARVIGRSEARRRVFDAVCAGKKRIKTVGEIAASTRFNRKQVLNAGKYLVDNQLFLGQTKKDGETAYEKDSFYAKSKRRILSLAGDPKKLEELPTKTNPRSRPTITLQVKLPKSQLDVRHITVDDIASLSKVRGVRKATTRNPVKISEKDFKAGFQVIIGEKGKFQDWGGEKNDLWTTQLKVKSQRLRAAIAFKGPGQRGVLTPKKLGKNGDQIQKLLLSDADVFLVQYWNQVDQTVYEQMKAFAIARSVTNGGETVWWGVIDGSDSARLIASYPDAFLKEEK